MAAKKGESVAFTAFYGWNLLEIANLLQNLKQKLQLTSIDLAVEVTTLLDYLAKKVDYDSVSEKQRLLYDYFDAVKHKLAGRKVSVELSGLIADLRQKAGWLFNHLRTGEWIKNAAGFQWFNGYYDNAGERVEGDHPNGVRMTLTGQVFAIMSGVAEDDQITEIIKSVNRYLKEPQLGGYRLNTDFAELKINLGRAFGFAYGHKENGAIFSHMAVMYGYALYERGFVKEGHDVLESLYHLAEDFEKGRIYPGIPEYFDAKGRGIYHYLTGSASWYLLALRNQVFGVRGLRGDLILEPKLLREQFDSTGKAIIQTIFAGRQLEIVYQNTALLDYGQYRIKNIRVNDQSVQYSSHNKAAIIARDVIERLTPGKT
jgi:cellobiose phosphorylase